MKYSHIANSGTDEGFNHFWSKWPKAHVNVNFILFTYVVRRIHQQHWEISLQILETFWINSGNNKETFSLLASVPFHPEVWRIEVVDSGLGVWRRKRGKVVEWNNSPHDPGLREEPMKVWLWFVTGSRFGLHVKRNFKHLYMELATDAQFTSQKSGLHKDLCLLIFSGLKGAWSRNSRLARVDHELYQVIGFLLNYLNSLASLDMPHNHH